jgi:hypothetical protein
VVSQRDRVTDVIATSDSNRQRAVDLVAALLRDKPDLTALASPDSWSLVKATAPSLGVAALVAYAARPHVAGEERAWCDRILLQSWQRHDQSLAQLDSVVATLEGAGIPAICLKGPLLAKRHYQPWFLRKHSVDLDLAVREKDLDRACEMLAREGYVLAAPLRRTKVLSYHAMLLHSSLRRVELHFRLSSGASDIPVDDLFERAERCELPGGRETWLLSPPDELLYLVLHLTGDRFANFFHTCEVRRVWAASPVEVRRAAIQRGIEHHCVGALKIADVACRSLWGEALLPPDPLLEKTWLDRRLNEDLYKAFAGWWKPVNALSLSNRLRGRWLDFQLTDRPADAFRMAQRLALTAWFGLKGAGWRTAKIPRSAPARSKRCA